MKCYSYIPFFTCNQVLVKALASSIFYGALPFERKTSCCCFRKNSFFRFPARNRTAVQVMIPLVKNYISIVKFNFYLHEWQQCTIRLCSEHGLFSAFIGLFFIYIPELIKVMWNTLVQVSGIFFTALRILWGFFPTTFIFIQVLMTLGFILSQIFLVSCISA